MVGATLQKVYMQCAVWFIVAVCVYDIYCTVMYREWLLDFEENSIAGLLIREDTHKIKMVAGDGLHYTLSLQESADVSLLVLFKVIGIFLAKAILDWLSRSSRRSLAVCVICPIVVMQTLLLVRLLL